MKKKLFFLSAALFLISAAVIAQDVGEKAPDFSFNDTKDAAHKLSDYKGKVVFIFTFGNGCPYCKASGPKTEKEVQQVFGARTDFQALGLDTWDNTSSTSTVGAFKSTTGITYPLLVKAGSFEGLYKTTYDRVLVIDQEGILRHKSNIATSSDLANAVAVIENLFIATGISDTDGLREGFSAVYPNPSSDQASIQLYLESAGNVEVRLYNTVGQEIKRIVNQALPAGEYNHEFSVSDLSPGIYFIRMNTPGASYTQKIQVSR
ncbi:T9SS type A sorting domain-containing protein [Bacteroidota bacterium]